MLSKVINNRNKILIYLKSIYKYIYLFVFFLAIYLFLGILLSYKESFPYDLLFSADTPRAVGDLTEILGNHYRIKVHPLFLILTQTITLVVNGIANEPSLAIILEQAFCGSISVCFLYAILKRLNISKLLRIICSFIYGFSFSLLLFSTTPETFIFAGLGLISYWYIVTCLTQHKGKLSIKEKFLLIFFGIVSFGITLTNYITYFIGLILVLICRYNLKKEFKKIIKDLFIINIFNVVGIIILCLFQAFVWTNSPIFITSIIDGLRGTEKYEEVKYMSLVFSNAKNLVWIKQIFFYPLLCPSLVNTDKLIIFDTYNLPIFIKAFFALLLLSTFILLLLYITKKIKEKDKYNLFYILFVAITITCNLILHYFYSYDVGFIYAVHFSFLYIILLAMIINNIKTKKLKTTCYILLIVLTIFEIINNLYRYYEMLNISMSMLNSSYSIMKAMKCIIFVIPLSILICLILDKKNKSDLYASDNKIIDFFVKNILIYLSIILVVGLFIAFNF